MFSLNIFRDPTCRLILLQEACLADFFEISNVKIRKCFAHKRLANMNLYFLRVINSLELKWEPIHRHIKNNNCDSLEGRKEGYELPN